MPVLRVFFSNFSAFSENLNFNWANLWPHPRPLQEYLLQMNSSPSQYSKLLQFWKQCFCWGLDLYEQNTHSLGFKVDYWFIRIKTSQVVIMFVVQILLIFFLFFIIFSSVYVVLNMRAVAICLQDMRLLFANRSLNRLHINAINQRVSRNLPHLLCNRYAPGQTNAQV